MYKKQLVIFTYVILFVSFGLTMELQAQTVTGTVIDAQTDESMPGVNISVMGTQRGTSTDSDGSFSLEVSSLTDTLVVSFVGYETRDVPIEGRTNLTITLEPRAIAGSEVIVTAFGVERQQRSLSYSTEGVSTESLTEARELNVMNSLQGKVAGLSISESGGGVGSSSRVVLRGNRSMSGNNEPLYVIDGVPIRGEYNEISPDNIESINVMKGPNAAALYGSEAQNGAIIIETRKGQKGEVQVSLNNSTQFAQPIHLLDFQNQYGQGLSGSYNRTSMESWGPPMDGRQVQHWSPDPEFADVQYSFEPRPDNFRKFFETGTNISTGLNASIGTETTTATFSFTRTDATGITPTNKLGRNNATVRINSQLNDWLSLDAKLDYMMQERNNPLSTGDTDNFNPYRNVYMLPRNISHSQYSRFEYIDNEGINRQNFWLPGATTGKNPYWVLHRNQRLQSQERIIGLASLTVNFTENMSLLARTSVDGSNFSRETKVWVNSYGSAFDKGFYSVGKSDSRLANYDLLLDYEDDLTPNWNIDARVGATLKHNIGGRTGSLSGNTTQELLVPNFFTLNNTQFPDADFNPSAETQTQSVFFSGTVGWQDAIYLDLTARNDWSSTLPKESRSFFYPSVGVSAIVNELIEMPDLISFLKIRGSYAQVGNSAPPHMLGRTANFYPGGNNGFIQLSSVLPAENLKPEQTESYEAGLDLRFFDGRLALDFTAYKTNTFNQLFTIALPTGSGAAAFFTNGGNVENRGFEFLLNARPVESTDFNWDVNFNYATNQNEVVEISDERPQIIAGGDSYMRNFVLEQGEEFGNIYSRGWVRDEQGRVIVGSDGLPQVTGGKTVKVANANPDWTGALTNSFNYKNFNSSFLIEHRQGGSVVSMTKSIMNGKGVTKETLIGRGGGLVFGEDIFTNETAVNEDGSPNNIETSAQAFWRNIGGRNNPVGEAFVESATTTRLREVTIGYSLPQTLINQLPLSRIQVSLVGRNLFYIYRAGDFDPDILTGTSKDDVGFNSFTRPTERTVGFNVKIDL